VGGLAGGIKQWQGEALLPRSSQVPSRLARELIVYAAAICCTAVIFAGDAFGQGRYSEIGQRVSRSVVKLETFDSEGQPKSLGSGFIVNSNGLIVTNYHVIRSAYQANATSANGDVYAVAGVVAHDAEKDFAIVKVTAFDLPAAELGNSNQVQILEEVIAIGHPLGLAYTSSTGVISAQRPQKGGFSMLQTTAPISRGNSGRPLVNLRGQVIGIVTEQMTQGQNLNFALPINYVRAALESNNRIRFTLREVAEAQAQKDADDTLKLFTIYEDKYKVYKALVPKSWRLANLEGWAANNDTYSIKAMTAPESAARADVNGYLSEGIRITVSMPQKGKVFTLATPAQLASDYSKTFVKNNPGFVQISESNSKVGQEPIKILEFLGQNPNVEEPEKTRIYMLAKPECRVIIEFVSPAAKFKDEDFLFLLFMKSFEFKGCPVW